MTMNIKFLTGRFLMYILNRCVMCLPSHHLRLACLRVALGALRRRCSFLMDCEFRRPGNILVGNGCVFNRGVLPDERGGLLRIGDNVDVAQKVVSGPCPMTHATTDMRTRAAESPLATTLGLATVPLVCPGLPLAGALWWPPALWLHAMCPTWRSSVVCLPSVSALGATDSSI